MMICPSPLAVLAPYAATAAIADYRFVIPAVLAQNVIVKLIDLILCQDLAALRTNVFFFHDHVLHGLFWLITMGIIYKQKNKEYEACSTGKG